MTLSPISGTFVSLHTVGVFVHVISLYMCIFIHIVCACMCDLCIRSSVARVWGNHIVYGAPDVQRVEYSVRLVFH